MKFMQTLSLIFVFASAIAFAETQKSPFQTKYTIVEGADKVLDTQDSDLTIESGRTALKPTPAIASGVTLTVDGTLLTTDVISGAGTLAGSGSVARVDEQETFAPDKTFSANVGVGGDLNTVDINASGDVTIEGTLFGGSPLDVGSILSLTDEGGTDTEIMRFSRGLDSTDFTAIMSRQVPSEGQALDFETNFYNGASRETRQALSITPDGDIGIGTDAPSQLLDVDGDAIFGGRGFNIKTNDATSIVNGATISLVTTGATGPGATGLVIVSAHRSSGANNLTGGTYFFASRGARSLNTISTQTLGAGCTFTITIDSVNTIVVTNTSGASCNITLTALYALSY